MRFPDNLPEISNLEQTIMDYTAYRNLALACIQLYPNHAFYKDLNEVIEMCDKKLEELRSSPV